MSTELNNMHLFDPVIIHLQIYLKAISLNKNVLPINIIVVVFSKEPNTLKSHSMNIKALKIMFQKNL